MLSARPIKCHGITSCFEDQEDGAEKYILTKIVFGLSRKWGICSSHVYKPVHCRVTSSSALIDSASLLFSKTDQSPNNELYPNNNMFSVMTMMLLTVDKITRQYRRSNPKS